MTYLTSLIARLSKTIGIGASTTSPPAAAAPDALPDRPFVSPAPPETTVAPTNGSS